jgi:phage shock protein E
MKRQSAIILGLLVALAAFAQPSAKLPARIGYAELSALLASPQAGILLLDVRTSEEFRAGHIPGAVLAPYDQIAASFSEKDKGRPIVVYCRSGRRSAIAKATLEGMGYGQVADFGAIELWKGKLAAGE